MGLNLLSASGNINSGGLGINIIHSQETAVPFPYNLWGRETALPSPLRPPKLAARATMLF